MRLPLALMATATALAVALTGCTASAPEPEASAGDSSDAVEVGGDFGEAPRVEFPTPLAPDTTQCTEVVEGDGELLVEGQQALVGLAIYNGSTGEEIEAPQGFGDEEGLPILFGRNTLPGLRKALSCGSEGSRVVAVVPPADAFGEEGNEQFGIEPEDSIVVVLDVKQSFLARANGSPQLTRDGFPAVVTAPDGRPGITVPDEEPFESTEVEVLKRGHGTEVESGDRVVVHYTGVLWDDNTVFDSSWEQGAPASFVVGDGDEAEVIPGFSKAIVGQTVGSQVGVVVTPEDGYGEQGSGSVPPGATLFFVVDILGVA